MTVTGVVGGTESYTVCAPAGPGVGAAPLDPIHIAGSGLGARRRDLGQRAGAGAGNTNTTVNLHGYRTQ